MKKEIEKLTKLSDNRFAVKWKGDRKTYLVKDSEKDEILAYLVYGVLIK